MFVRTFFSLLLVSLVPLAGCKQELPSKVEASPVFGIATDMRTVDSEKQLLYTEGQDPTKKVWGLAASYYVTVDNKPYKLHWDQAEKFKGLKAGDRVNLHPSEYISCTGEADLKPVCVRLMRIYKSERRIEPIKPAN